MTWNPFAIFDYLDKPVTLTSGEESPPSETMYRVRKLFEDALIVRTVGIDNNNTAHNQERSGRKVTSLKF